MIVCIAVLSGQAALRAQTGADWRTWSASEAESITKSAIARSRIAGGRRVLNTERARSYKVAVVCLTPEVLRASARLIQLRSRLDDSQTSTLLDEAERTGDLVVMIDIDPDEGSGVVPLTWEAILQPHGDTSRSIAGTKMPALGDVRVLAEAVARNYDYDRFWIAFSLTGRDGQPVFRDTDAQAELIVRIYDRETRIACPIPASIRTRASGGRER